MNHTRVLLAACIAVLASCSDSSGPSGLSGTASFTYSGGTTGSFTVSGRIPLNGQTETAEWAAGFRDDAEQVVGLIASRPRAGDKHDLLFLGLPRVTAGSSTISTACTGDDCAAVFIDLNADNSTGDADFSCLLLDGTITITSISSSRFAGTFNGTGECDTLAGGLVAFTVTNGSFDVAIISGVGGV